MLAFISEQRGLELQRKKNDEEMIAQAPGYRLAVFASADEVPVLRYDDRLLHARIESNAREETHSFELRIPRPEYLSAELARMVMSATPLDKRILREYSKSGWVERVEIKSVSQRELTDYLLSLTRA